MAVAAAAVFLIRSERQIASSSTALRVFDLHARETAAALTDMRTGQQAYVAAGQGVAFWMPKVTATMTNVKGAIVSLREQAASVAARAALMDAEAAITEFETIDKRARDYINSGELLMAADVIFTEGGERATDVGRQVEFARLAERQAFDRDAASVRRSEATALGAAAVFVALVILLLVPVRRVVTAAEEPPVDSPAPETEPQPSLSASARTTAILRSTADICTEFARVRDFDDLKRLLARAAEALDASGLVVWLGTTSGGDLRPVVAHGYPPHVVARMPAVPRSADNAAAAAYRTRALQIVVSRPGQSSGAIVAPLVAADGCIGALSAEIRGGSEGSDSIQALIAIFAAHVAGVFAGAVADSAEPRAAAQR
jgi:hypothetical protein